MNISKISIERPVTTVMMVFVILLVGAISLMGIPMDLLPEFELPVAIVLVDYPNASPEEVETMVTRPLEQSLASVENMDTITSMTTEGRAVVMVEFAMKTDMDFAALDMREKVAMVSGFLPSGASDPMVLKMSMDFTPVVAVYVSSDRPLSELNREVEDNILSYFERSPGVASVDAFGGISEEIAIHFDQEKLSGYGLSLSTISQLLAAENVNMPSGDVSKGSTKVIVRTLGEFKSIEDIKQIPIPLPDRSVIRLSDLATIDRGFQEQTSISRVDGATAIGITVSKQSTANTVDVSDGIAKTLESLRERYPDYTFTIGFDQADYIKSSVSSVAQSALIGAFLAILVIFLFLRNMSSTMIIALSIPTSFFATFAIMNLTGMTLNLITLSALTLAVGMLVDNSIVALENIYRVSQEDGGRPSKEAALIGSKQIGLAISASTLTSVVVYLPIALSSGISALLFADFCWTFIIALMVSLLVAITVVPMLSSKLLDRKASVDYLKLGKHHYRYRLIPYFTRFLNWLTMYYGEIIVRALKHRKRVVVICLVIFLLSTALVAVVGMEFMPASDEAMFSINIDAPYGTSLAEKDRYMSDVEKYILSLPELEHCSIDVSESSSFGGMGGGGSSATMRVNLVPKQDRKRSVWDIIDATQREFENLVGAEVTVVEASSVMAMLGGSDISLSIRGPE
ncbi:MAG: efflux RND transporter permease subunit, partial [Erysipelotrichales bacterium]